MKPILEIRNISKKFRISHQKQPYLSLRDSMVSLFSRNNMQSEDFWALSDISFDLFAGDSLGIIGKNGAGKSTLLKILSRITPPTSGRITSRGRIASLLEVGTGFHPELSGRENIFLNGSILGMKRKEIEKKFDEIVSFSGTEQFLDTALKHYSSGMQLRLAFSVAAFLEPEILIIDEVLAVGDAEFQKKCIGKMNEISSRGRTILFVSHNMAALKNLCTRGIVLQKGSIATNSPIEEAVNFYLNYNVKDQLEFESGLILHKQSNSFIKDYAIRIHPEFVGDDSVITVKTPLKIEVEFENLQDNLDFNISIVLNLLDGTCILNTGSGAKNINKGKYKTTCHIPGNFLNDGIHSIDLYMVKDESTVIYSQKEALMFEVQDADRQGAWYGKWIGIVRPGFKWEYENI